MKVKDMMHKGVDWVSPDTPITEARTQSENGPLAGSQLLSLSMPGDLAPAYSVSEPS